MSEIAMETERRIDYKTNFQKQHFKIQNRVDAISHAACTMAIDLDAKAIVVTSLSGLTVRMVSRFRNPITILGLATSKKAWYKLSLSWGVLPMLTEQFPSMEVLYYYASRAAKSVLNLSEGDTIVMTGGNTSGESGNTNVLRIETIV
jgi:pyruvate kinase